MAKIKKYTIDEEIPKGVTASSFLESKVEHVRRVNKSIPSEPYIYEEEITYFYFLVEEEKGCKCFPLNKNTCFFTNLDGSRCSCKCHFPKI